MAVARACDCAGASEKSHDKYGTSAPKLLGRAFEVILQNKANHYRLEAHAKS
jgi:hypothetical protein